MKTPKAIWFIAIILFIYGVGCAYWLLESKSYILIVLGVGAWLGSYGLIRKHRWSQYIVYFINLLMVAAFAFNTFRAINTSKWYYANTLERMYIVIPVGLVFVVCVLCCYVVFKFMKKGST